MAFSVFNYIPVLFDALNGTFQVPVMSVPRLTLALFMILSYTLYPIEVISPGWLNFKRLLLWYAPIAVILIFYRVTLLFGVEYPVYSSIVEMLPHYADFNVAFRLLLCIILCLPIFFIFYIPYTRKYNNTDRTWMRVYVISGIIDVLSYLMILAYHTPSVSILYFHCTMAITALRLYMELVYRIVDKNVTNDELISSNNIQLSQEPSNGLFIRLERYMLDNQIWRNPDLSEGMLVQALGTNRTTLAKAVREQGVDSISSYINKYRIQDFISLLKDHPRMSIKEAFYICGYRSRATAQRNFRSVTGKTPSEYLGR
ncbi:MAG: helix-turn-helix domain-containing protein [Bacteroidales bacterium]|nr:helix-turn-helix domain-containing protein [Bacteroidales bacterium]MDD4671247.1 helix-turn-helix domain-containing protein [Bacteroidales bacterium]